MATALRRFFATLCWALPSGFMTDMLARMDFFSMQALQEEPTVTKTLS
jgi:hypothetical protein